MKKAFSFLLIMIFLLSSVNAPVFAAGLIPEYLCETGINLYQHGRYQEALGYFKKALLANPGYKPAQKYIFLIQSKGTSLPVPSAPKEVAYIPQNTLQQRISTPAASNVALPLVRVTPQIKAEFVKYPPKNVVAEEQIITPVSIPDIPVIPSSTATVISKIKDFGRKIAVLPPLEGTAEEKDGAGFTKISLSQQAREEIPPLIMIILEEGRQEEEIPLELIKTTGEAIVRGQGIQRFLATMDNIVEVERISNDELKIRGQDYGFTYLHLWDNRGRWTLAINTISKSAKARASGDEIYLEEERVESFRIRYGLNSELSETGRRLYVRELRKQSYRLEHFLEIYGPSPYGDLNFFTQIERLNHRQNMTELSLWLENGRWRNFKGFSLDLFDFRPTSSNLAYSGTNLRGVNFSSPAFKNLIEYSLFWGKEAQGRYGPLTPDLATPKNSYVEGANLRVNLNKKNSVVAHAYKAYGNQRTSGVPGQALSAEFRNRLGKTNSTYEIAHDMERIAQRFRSNFNAQNYNLGFSFRNIDKNYQTITGRPGSSGEFGGTLSFSSRPTEKIYLSSSIDSYLNHLNPNPLEDDEWNINTNSSLSYNFSDNTVGTLSSYNYFNRGYLSPTLSRTYGFGINHRIPELNKLSLYGNYYEGFYKSYNSPASNYLSHRLLTGARIDIWKDFYLYARKEFTVIEEVTPGKTFHPHAFESGVGHSLQVFDTPWYIDHTFRYRKEDVNPGSTLSFLSGDDYIEGTQEIRYAPTNLFECYFNTRIRNVWAYDKENNRVDLNLRSGMRYTWDTKLKWHTVGGIKGYVFKDLNNDGIRNSNEYGIPGVELHLAGTKEIALTNYNGYYEFKGVRARKTAVSVETITLPKNYVLTTNYFQQLTLVPGLAARADFGASTSTGIAGTVFIDKNSDGELQSGEAGVANVTIILDNGAEKTKTNSQGYYFFPETTSGSHKVELALDTLPINLIPQVPVFTEIQVSEGESYKYDIPVANQ